MNKMRYLLTALAMVIMSSPAYAATTSLINIKFAPVDTPSYQYTGAAVIGSSVDYWNNIVPDDNSGGVTAPLTKANPIVPLTGTSLTFTSEALGIIGNSSNSFYGVTPDYSKLMKTYVYTYGTGSMTIGGLTAGTNYDVYVLTQGTKLDPGSKLKLTGLTSSGVQSFTQTGLPTGANNTFVAGTNYMLETFKTDAGGNLTFSYTAATGGKALINGLQIATSQNTPPTPEPASMVLIGVGGALMSAMKLRKKKAAENPVA